MLCERHCEKYEKKDACWENMSAWNICTKDLYLNVYKELLRPIYKKEKKKRQKKKSNYKINKQQQ